MPQITDGLNNEQLLCVKALDGPVLVLAGAGSGKTRVLTHRIACLIKERGINPYNIIAITFTNKAAGEMKERLDSMLGLTDGMWVCTIHSMCNRILRQFIDRIGYTKSFSIYAEDDKERVLKRIIAENINKEDTEGENILKEVKYHISNAKNKFLSPEKYKESGFFGKNFDIVCNIYSRYEKQLKTNNALDFDDLILKTYQLFLEDKDCLSHFQDKFKYIHIDEFQDTNIVQYKLIKLLANKHKNLFAVGDDDQSIYGFRGAEVENIYRFQKDFKNTKLLKLQRNYRSTKKILSLANTIIKNNSMRMTKELWTENSEGVRAEKYEASDERDEAIYVSSKIKQLVTYNGYKYSDFAVLVRMNALSNSFEQQFLNYGIPYRVFGGYKFFERKEIKDIIAYLRLIVNPFDEESLLRVINFPKRGIGNSAINQLKNVAIENNCKLYDVILNINTIKGISTTLKNKIINFKNTIIDIMQSSQLQDMPDFIKHLLEVSGFNQAYDSNTEENINRKLNIDEFINSFTKYFEDNPTGDIESYLTSITLISDIDNMDDSGVSIATIHSVKGLEFKVVFIAGLDDGLFPVKRAYNEPDQMEEERRLMYVAITRAKERLFLTRAKSRFLYGQRNYTLPSNFLKELSMHFESKSMYKQNNLNEKSNYYNNTNNHLESYNNSRYTQNNEIKQKVETDLTKFKEGSKVFHQKFGEGVIVQLNGSGNSAMADIAFPKIGVKTFTLKFAPLKLI